MKKTLLIIALLLSLYSNSQTDLCGFDTIREAFLRTNASFRQKEKNSNQLLYEQAIISSAERRKRTAIRYIPVVVHIIHQGGSENISNAAVIAGINQLNQRFQNSAPYYDSVTGNNTQIQFCLASIDPQGNPTSGITRDISLLTYLDYSNDVAMKNLNRWDPLYYFNIWTVKQIFGLGSVSGYSSMPAQNGDNTDGVVILANAFTSTTLTHETGHYLGLYHTFSGGCTNFNCLLNGDMVCDTPPDASSSGCMTNSCSTDLNDTTGLSPFTADVNELPNYMDYTSCRLSFSQGQADRMNNTLTVIRNLLLQSAGCGFSGGAAPVASFNYTISPCNDGMVSFDNSPSINITTVNWDFDNNGTYDSFTQNPAFTFPLTGTYTVKLLAVGPGGKDSAYQTIFVQKGSTLYYPIASYGSIFPNPTGGFKSCGNYTVNFTAAPGQSYLWSTGDTTQTISFVSSTSFTLTLTMVDNAGLTWTNALCHPLTVAIAPLPPVPFIYSTDPLNICVGDTITFHSTVSPAGDYIYRWYENASNVATGLNDSVFTDTGSGVSVPYQLIIGDTNSCYNYSNYLYVNAYSPPVMQTLTQSGTLLTSGWGGGNQWYLNGTPISGATGTTYTVTQSGCYSVGWFFGFAPQCYTMSDTLCYTSVGLYGPLLAENNLFVYPNPVTSQLTINFSDTQTKTIIQITDIAGKVIDEKLILDNNKCFFDMNEKAKGLYFLRVEDENKNISTRRIIKQ